MFLVDMPTFAKVCSLGDADAAAAYLVLAAGTGADNRTSTWSREAINKRTALNWRKADAAMMKLEQNGLIRWLEGKGTRKPRIDLPPLETRKPMKKHVADLATRVALGEKPRTPEDKVAATIGRIQGWLACDDAGTWSFLPKRPAVLAFLPMELVGDAFGMVRGSTTSIVERIRMARDPMAFQLLLDFYAQQDLAEHNGVDRQYFYQKFTREKAGATGPFQLWEYTRQSSWIDLNGPFHHHKREPSVEERKQGRDASSDFFDRTNILLDAGALEWVYFLAEDESNAANLIYPVAVERHGKMIWNELESVVGGYAIRAASALQNSAPEFAEAWEQDAPCGFFLPAARLARQANVVGVPRLRHRARTSNTSRWRQELVESAETWIAVFRGIIAENAPNLLAAADQRFADFNGASTLTSNLDQCDINVSSQPPIHSASPISGAVVGAPVRTDELDVGIGSTRAIMPDWWLDGDEPMRADETRNRA